MKNRLAESLAFGLPIPILLGFYSLFLEEIVPEEIGIRTLAGVQATFFALLMTSLLGLLAIRLHGKEWEVWSRCREHRKEVLWLNFFTFLGPPLYALAIVLMGAGPANWLDLGMTPVITMALAFTGFAGTRPRGTRTWVGISLAVIGVLLVMYDVKSREGVTASSVAGIILACVSSLGTACAAAYLAKLQKIERGPLAAEYLLPVRYALPTLILGVIWIAVGNQTHHSGIVMMGNPLWIAVGMVFFFLLPQYLIVAILKKRSLLFSAYLWALVPVFGSLAEFIWLGTEKASLSVGTTVAAGVLILTSTLLTE